MTVIPAHLGGYWLGGDPATYFPELWSWLVTDLNVKRVIDVGCGEGQALEYFGSLDCYVVGVDGVEQPDPRIVQHDYTEEPFIPAGPLFDLCWSSEFVEHVEEEFIANFLATFQHADWLLMTHADPGQLGHHHVNCQPRGYWIERIEDAGFEYHDELTRTTRRLASANETELNHYRRSGLAFRRQEA